MELAQIVKDCIYQRIGTDCGRLLYHERFVLSVIGLLTQFGAKVVIVVGNDRWDNNQFFPFLATPARFVPQVPLFRGRIAVTWN